MGREVKLPSGATLQITVASFSESKALYMAVADEMKGLRLDPKAQVDVNFWKDLFMTGIASAKIEAALQPCMKRSLYNSARIGGDTFEPVEARDDYFQVCYEVAKENIAPFTKSLYAQYAGILEKVQAALA